MKLLLFWNNNESDINNNNNHDHNHNDGGSNNLDLKPRDTLVEDECAVISGHILLPCNVDVQLA